MSAHDLRASSGFYRLPFVDRVNECRLICHPDIRELRDGEKACCVVVAKQPGAGKIYLGKECLKIALENEVEGYTQEEWEARLPVCTLHCEAKKTDTLATVLMRLARYAAEGLDQLRTASDLKAEVEKGGRCDVVEGTVYGVDEAREILEVGEVPSLVGRLVEGISSLDVSEETKEGFRSKTKKLVNELIRKLHNKPLSEWAKIVHEIMTDPVNAYQISEWLSVKAREISIQTAALRLAEACRKWNRLFCTKSRPAALLLVIDEAQWVLPNGIENEQEKENVRDVLKAVFEVMQPIFVEARFLWTGVSSAAVEFEMSNGDDDTSFRVVSITLPPLDVMQWTEALERADSRGAAANLMQEMIEKLREKAAEEDAWADIADEPDKTKRDEELKRRALAEMMSCTGGWPRKVREFLYEANKMQWDWISRVFGGSKRRQRMEDFTTQLLDRAYMEPDMEVLRLVKTIDIHAERIFYELLHTSGMRLVKRADNAPVIYVPRSAPEVIVGVEYTSDLAGVRLHHTTGSLLLQASVRKQTQDIHAVRGKYEAFTHDPAEEATVNTLSHLDAFCDGRTELKHVFPWLKSAPADIC